jgi:chromosomal replication initiator protein
VSGEYESFLADVADAVAQHVEPWRVRIAEAIAEWTARGFRVDVLERAMRLPKSPDVDGLLATFAAATEHLLTLEAQARAVDPGLGGHPAFRDPERVGEAESLATRALSGVEPLSGPLPDLTRETFEVGASNQQAVRAAEAVAANPGERYNPVFIHGPGGVGKTHLAHALANDLVNASGGALVAACVNAEAFANELVNAIQERSVDRWRARYRAVDALVIDDVHAVADKERTQAELNALIDELTRAGKQVVVTAYAPPAEITGIDGVLRSQLEGGLVVEIERPDRALRERLYARHFEHVRPVVEAELVRYLSARPAPSVRDVAATALRLLAAAQLAGVPLTLRLAQAELEGSVRTSTPTPGFVSPVAAGGAVDPYFLDDEKLVWDWPDAAGRLIEELR